MVSLEDGAVIDDHDGEPATLQALGVYVTTPEDTNLMAGFSSWGPTHGDLLIKPDVVAPGADIVSSFPQHRCEPERPTVGCWSFLGGTSMATPHLAGAAAVVRGDHPDWTRRAGPLGGVEHRPAGPAAASRDRRGHRRRADRRRRAGRRATPRWRRSPPSTR